MIENNCSLNDEVQNKSNNMIIIFIIFSIVSFLFCLYFTIGTYKSYLSFLPLCFAIMSFFLYISPKNLNNNISIILINILFFIRMSVLPFLYSFNIDYQLFESKLNVCDNFQKACLLMVYEFIAVQLTIIFHIYFKKEKKFVLNSRKHINHRVSDYLMIILLIFIIICYIFFNSYIPSFKTIFSLGKYEFTIASENLYLVGSFGRIINTLFVFSFQLFRVLFPAYIIHKLYLRKYKHSLLVLSIFCFLQFLFLTSTFAEAIIVCLCLVLYYLKLYPQKKKQVFILLLLSTVGIFFLYFIVRFYVKANKNMYDKNNPIVYISQMTNAYFTGVDNVSASFNVSSIHKAEALKADLIGAIPFNSTIFKNKGNKFQYFYNNYNKSYGQIPPTIGIGYYFFGILLAPIISIIFTKMSLVYFDKSNSVNQSFKYVATIYCSIIFAIGLVMYNSAITLILYFGWGIPMLLISQFSDKKLDY